YLPGGSPAFYPGTLSRPIALSELPDGGLHAGGEIPWILIRLRLQGLADANADLRGKRHPATLGEDPARSPDMNGDHRHPGLDGEIPGAGLERLDAAIVRTRPLRIDDQIPARAQELPGAPQHLPGVTSSREWEGVQPQAHDPSQQGPLIPIVRGRS